MKMTLNWPRDREGYHIETVPAGRGDYTLKTLPEGNLADVFRRKIHRRPEAYDVIVRNGGKLWSRPVVVPALYEKLGACTANSKDALSFSNQYGLLGSDHDKMEVEHFRHVVRSVRRLIALAKKENWEKISEWLKGPKEMDWRELPGAINFSGDIGYDEEGRPQLEYRPRSLDEFIFAQLIQDYTGGAKYKLCIRPGCGEYFYYGSGTGKRNTAVYCSAKCQKAHQYMKLKGEVK